MKQIFKQEAGIYIFTNKKSGKVCVGETKNMQKRMWEYRHPRKRFFERAVKKNGLDGFNLEIYYLPNFSKKDLLDLEEELIKKFNSIAPNGYNICPRGSDHTGRKASPESRAKMSEAQRGNKKNLGNKHSAETRQKMSKAAWGGKNQMAKKVNQFNKDGEFMKQWTSINGAERETGVKAGRIRRSCKFQGKLIGGFIWKYADPIQV